MKSSSLPASLETFWNLKEEDALKVNKQDKENHLPIQKLQVADVSTLSEDWATNSQHD